MPDPEENDSPAGETTDSVEAETGADDDIYIDALSTERDADHTCQVNMTALLPENLRLDIFADLRCITSHTVYRLPLYFENEYTQRW